MATQQELDASVGIHNSAGYSSTGARIPGGSVDLYGKFASDPYATSSPALNPSVIPPAPVSPVGLPSGYNAAAITAPLGSADRTNQLLAEASKLTGVAPQTFTGQANQSAPVTALPPNIGEVLGANTTPTTPKTPIDTTKLPVGGATDLSKILGAGLGTGNGTSDIAGLSALLAGSTEASKNYDAETKQLTDLITSLGNEPADVQAALDEQGVGDAFNHVKELNLQAAQMKGKLDAFDAETKQLEGNIEGQAIPTGLILGQKGQLNKQRDLTRLSMASEYASTIALAQAYQGNAELGLKLASQAIDLKYKPILAQIEAVKTQISIAEKDMSREDAKSAKLLDLILSSRKEELTTQKQNETKLETIGIQAASGGAPLSLVNAAKATGDPVQMASQLAAYLKGPTESIAGNGQQFTTTQSNSGASNAGLSTTDFQTLDADVKNYFINSSASAKQFLSDLSGVKDGSINVDEAKTTIDSSNLPTNVKEYLKQRLQEAAPIDNGGGFLSSISDFFSGAADSISKLLPGPAI